MVDPSAAQSYAADALQELLAAAIYRAVLLRPIWDNPLFIFMFDRAEGIRLSHSPSSGGQPSLPNPAWDSQFIIPKYDVLQEYGFRARAIYRERCSREEIEQEFRTWRASLEK